MKRQRPDHFLVPGWSRGDLSDEQSQKASMPSIESFPIGKHIYEAITPTVLYNPVLGEGIKRI